MDVSLRSLLQKLGCLVAIACVIGPVAATAQTPLTDPQPADVQSDRGTEPPADQDPTDQDVADFEEPYVVFVADASAHAWCGPGEQYYRTEKLRRGQELNVYVETEDGWLGIQPPEESFCWLPASAVTQSKDGSTAVIRRDETPVWIGTNLGRAAKYLWQIELHEGEEVAVISRVERSTKQGPVTWLKIVPPSGEFRWVHERDVVGSAEQLVEKIAAASNALKPSQREPLEKRDPRVVQAGSIDPTMEELREEGNLGSDPRTSTRRGAQKLRAASGVPTLAPAPTDDVAQNTDAASRVPDRPIHFLGDARAEDYRDRGAVVGSGLKDEWNGENGESVLNGDGLTKLPVNGAAAAAAAIAAPIRRVSDVVANFMSPPRFVEINGATPRAPNTAIDRQWMVGSTREPASNPQEMTYGVPIGNRSFARVQDPRLIETQQPGVMQAGALLPLETNPRLIAQASRVVTSEQIARVENAMVNADLNTASRVLSQLMAEGASADETDPLIRRIQTLQQEGDYTQATRTREMLNRANEYRNLAMRRDGATRIQSTVQTAATPMQPTGMIPVPSQTPPSQTSLSQTATQSIGPPVGMQPLPNAPQPAGSVASGYLVQVYSARSDRPPYALTDDAGLTVAYITPYPGVNLRNHLNSRIEVRGNERMLPEMNTPHILVDSVKRR